MFTIRPKFPHLLAILPWVRLGIFLLNNDKPKIDELVKSCISDGFVKKPEIKACESLRKEAYLAYVAVTKDEA